MGINYNVMHHSPYRNNIQGTRGEIMRELETFKGAIFDLDGVLVDTAKFHYRAWQRLATELGFHFSEEDNERLKGVSRTRSLEILLEIGGLTLDDQEMNRLATLKNSWYVDLISEMDEKELLEGAKAYLIKLKEEGVKIALGSASKNAMLILDLLKITYLFDAIIDGTKVSKAKPDPEVFTVAAQALGLNPEACVVFEDAVAGIEAAKSAGIFVVGIGESGTLKEADFVVNGLYELLVV